MNKRRNQYSTKKYLKDNPKCEFCNNQAEEVHHIIPVVAGGTDNTDNLMSLCKHCHKLIHKKITPSADLIKMGRELARREKSENKKMNEQKSEEYKFVDVLNNLIYLVRKEYEQGENWTSLLWKRVGDERPKNKQIVFLMQDGCFISDWTCPETVDCYKRVSCHIAIQIDFDFYDINGFQIGEMGNYSMYWCDFTKMCNKLQSHILDKYYFKIQNLITENTINKKSRIEEMKLDNMRKRREAMESLKIKTN